MKKALGIFLLLASLGIPLFLYLSLAATGFDTYTISMICGVTAYILICNQFILASRPRFLVSLFGQKGVLRLHSVIPVLIIIFTGAHPLLKELSGFSDETLQARLGTSVLVIMGATVVFTVLFMANTVWLKLSPLAKLKKWVYEKTGLTYKGARVVHNLFAIGALILSAHVLLASTSSFQANPAGMIWMAGWMLFSLGLYIQYRLSGRHAGKNKQEVTL
jgi:predicted ferric reductase